MEFVKHDLVPFAACPGFAPAVGARVDRLARAVDVVRLKARRGIGNALSARERKPVACAGRQTVDKGLVKAILVAPHRDGIATIEHERDLLLPRRPKTKSYPIVLERRAVPPPQRAVLHSRQPARFEPRT